MKAIFVSTAILALASPALANNLIRNPGFEVQKNVFQNSFADWLGGDGGLTADFRRIDFEGFGLSVYEGQWYISIGCIDFACSINQTIQTLPNTKYTLSFAFNRGIGAEAPFASSFVFWNKENISGEIGIGREGWAVYEYEVVGTGEDVLTFSSFQTSSFNGYDDVRLTANAIPEPASWAMMIAGFGLVGTAGRRRKARAVAA